MGEKETAHLRGEPEHCSEHLLASLIDDEHRMWSDVAVMTLQRNFLVMSPVHPDRPHICSTLMSSTFGIATVWTVLVRA